jgi:23S rRNA (guanine745-N1)-methyltransferase
MALTINISNVDLTHSSQTRFYKDQLIVYVGQLYRLARTRSIGPLCVIFILLQFLSFCCIVWWHSPPQHATIHPIMALTHLLTCPFCSLPLSVVGNTFTCAKAHSFDIAREGYVNLLRKKLPGDTKEMLVARRQFLEQGYYQPLSDQLNELIYAHLPTSAPKVLDAGCGEGYYLGRLQHFLAQKQPAIQGEYVGIDISKDAIRLAARCYHECSFVVANLKERFVFADGTLDILLNIFAPHNVEEFARVMAPGGLLMLVIPGPTHLLQLRQQFHLLNIEEQKQQRVMEQFAPSFKLLTTSTLHYTLHLDNKAFSQLVMMTPNFWHLSAEIRQAMLGIEELQTEVEFICMVWLHE